MIVESGIFNAINLNDLLKAVILLLLIFYTIFALVVVRQVDLMSRTLVTPISPLVKAVSLFNLGFGLGLIVLSFGLL